MCDEHIYDGAACPVSVFVLVAIVNLFNLEVFHIGEDGIPHPNIQFQLCLCLLFVEMLTTVTF